jgi:hypothetical protein
VRGNTFSALGIVAHRISERCQLGEWDAVPADDWQRHLKEAYEAEVETMYEELKSEWTPAVVPVPRDWPFFNKKMAITIAEGRRLLQRRSSIADGVAAMDVSADSSLKAPAVEGGQREIEHDFHDNSIALKGRPDRVVYDGQMFDIVDLKSGPSEPEITDAFRRQLTLYAHLVSRDTGLTPRSIVIESAAGDRASETLSLDDVRAVVDKYREDVAKFRETCTRAEVFMKAASPGIDTCRYCDFKVTCPVFWGALSATWQAGCIRGIAREDARETSVTLRVNSPADHDFAEVAVTDLIHTGISAGSTVAIAGGYLVGDRLQCRWDTRLSVWDPPIA